MEVDKIYAHLMLFQAIDPKEDHITDREGIVTNLMLFVNDLNVL